MATAIEQFTKLQGGIETTKGTLVAATRLLQGQGYLHEQLDFYRSPYPRQIRATVGGAGSIVRKGVMVNFESELTFEEVLWPLLTGVVGAVTPTATASLQTWVFTPVLTTGVPTIDAATFEFIRSDGVTNHYYGESGYCMTDSFSIEFNFNQPAKLSWQMFGRARQTDTPTAGLSVYSSREVAISNLCKVFLDTTWAGLGGTQLNTIVRSAKLDVSTGLAPDYTLDGRADLDMTKHIIASGLGAKLSLTLEFDATGASFFSTYYRANAQAYIRLIVTGRTISAGVSTVQIDGSYRFASEPQFSIDGDNVLVQADLEAVYDTTGTKILEFTVKNALSAVT